MLIFAHSLCEDGEEAGAEVGRDGLGHLLQLLGIGEEGSARMTDSGLLLGGSLADEAKVGGIQFLRRDGEHLFPTLSSREARRAEGRREDVADVEHVGLGLQGRLLLLRNPSVEHLPCLLGSAEEFRIVAQNMVDATADEGVGRVDDDGVQLEVVGIGDELGGRFLFSLLPSASSQQQGRQHQDDSSTNSHCSEVLKVRSATMEGSAPYDDYFLKFRKLNSPRA